MSKHMKKQQGKSAGKPNHNNQKPKAKLAKKNGVHKPNPAVVKKSVNQSSKQSQKKQKQNLKPQSKPQKFLEPKFDSDSEEEDVKDGIFMFKGLTTPLDKAAKKPKAAEQSSDDSDDSDSDDSLDESALNKTNDSDSEDSNDDLDFLDSDESEDSDDSDGSNDSDDESPSFEEKPKGRAPKDSKKVAVSKKAEGEEEESSGDTSVTEDDSDQDGKLDPEETSESEEDFENDSDEDSDEEMETPVKKANKSLEMKDLLGKSIEEDDDDDDFEAESDSDSSAESDSDDTEIDAYLTESDIEDPPTDENSPMKNKEPGAHERTILVRNLPVETTEKKLRKLFKNCGPIESIEIAKKNKKFPDRIQAHIIFVEKASAPRAVCLNGNKMQDNILQITTLTKFADFDTNKAVFIGNLPYGIEFDEVYNLFKKCGVIDNLRLIRDKHTGRCKGFGYVNFSSEDSVPLALQLSKASVGGREIRIFPCVSKPKTPEKKAEFPKNQSRKRKSNDFHNNKKPFGKRQQQPDSSPSPVKKSKKHQQQAAIVKSTSPDVSLKVVKNKKKHQKNQQQPSQMNQQQSQQMNQQQLLLKNQQKLAQNKNQQQVLPMAKKSEVPKKQKSQFEGQKAEMKKKKNKPNKDKQQKKVMAQKLATKKKAKA